MKLTFELFDFIRDENLIVLGPLDMWKERWKKSRVSFQYWFLVTIETWVTIAQ